MLLSFLKNGLFNYLWYHIIMKPQHCLFILPLGTLPLSCRVSIVGISCCALYLLIFFYIYFVSLKEGHSKLGAEGCNNISAFMLKSVGVVTTPPQTNWQRQTKNCWVAFTTLDFKKHSLNWWTMLMIWNCWILFTSAYFTALLTIFKINYSFQT